LVTALLIETVSIQNYVYASNKLLENVGASNIVTIVYQEKMLQAIQETLQSKVDKNLWKRQPETFQLEKNNTDFEIGYIGGGNALLFFRKTELAKKFIKKWTTELLVEAPGLNLAFAMNSTFNFDNFSSELQQLFTVLKENKNKYFPLTTLPKHGVTAECPFSGNSAETYFKDMDGEKFISSVSKTKLEYAKIINNKLLAEDVLENKYVFTTNIDKLGQIPSKNHIAVVHIDGNSIGKYFMNCTTLPEIRGLSKHLDKVIYEAYKEFITFIKGNMGYFFTEESGLYIQNVGDKIILPFRPLLVEGDDITFITDGRLGISFAKKFLELISRKSLPNGKQLSASAGVAITSTKHPFYRGYVLAEELCSAAKKEARKNPGTSWLDFHVAYSGISGNLEDIRKDNYTINEGQLNFGPYLISNQERNKDNEKNIMHLLKGIKRFINLDNWPRNKVKEFRNILALGKKPAENYLKQMNIKGKEVEAIPGKGYHISGWENNKTPYFDMIELMDFYPIYFLGEQGGGKVAKI
jgi:hypothetical protein